jgi:Resolvase, N terminal domain
MIVGYARVSTDGQTLDSQQAALAAAGATKVYAETASGAKTDRAQLAKALAGLASDHLGPTQRCEPPSHLLLNSSALGVCVWRSVRLVVGHPGPRSSISCRSSLERRQSALASLASRARNSALHAGVQNR